MGFDEDEATLEAIREGTIAGTVVQDPFLYGFESVRVLAALARGDQTVLPPSEVIDIPARTVTPENVDAFQRELQDRLGGSGM